MVIANDSLKAPETPALDWGISPRNYKFADFTLFWIFASVSAVLAMGFLIPSVASGALSPTVSVGMVSLGMFIPMALFSLIVIIHGISQPAEEAAREATLMSVVWQNYALRPYLEERYNVKFDSRDTILGYTHGYFPCANYKGRSISVKIDGIDVYRNRFKFSSLSHPYYVVNPEKIHLSEVILPETITYKNIPAV